MARSSSLPGYEEGQIVEAAYSLLVADHGGKPAKLGEPSENPGPTFWAPPLVNIGVFINQFVSMKAANRSAKITSFLQRQTPRTHGESTGEKKMEDEDGERSAASTVESPAKKRVCSRPAVSKPPSVLTMLRGQGQESGRRSPSVNVPVPEESALAGEGVRVGSVPLAGDNATPVNDDVMLPSTDAVQCSSSMEANSHLPSSSFLEESGCNLATLQPGGQSEDHTTCQRCGASVLAWDMPEHNDFHFAQDLQAQERQAATSSSSAGGSQATHVASRTGKIRRTSQTHTSKRSIESFFQRKQ